MLLVLFATREVISGKNEECRGASLLVPFALSEVVYGKRGVQRGYAPGTLRRPRGDLRQKKESTEGLRPFAGSLRVSLRHTLLPPSLRKGVRGMVHRLLKVCVFLGYHFAQGVS